MRYMPHSSHSSWFDHPHFVSNTDHDALQHNMFLHFPVTSSLLAPDTIFLSTLISNILSLRSSLSVTDQVSHAYKTTGKVIVLYILMSVSLDSKWKTKYYVLRAER
jgi:hypothetical protein